MEKQRCSCCDARDGASGSCAECSKLKADEANLKADADIPILMCPGCGGVCPRQEAKFCENCCTRLEVKKARAELQGKFYHEFHVNSLDSFSFV